MYGIRQNSWSDETDYGRKFSRWNAYWNSSSARRFLVIESRKIERQLVATHCKETMRGHDSYGPWDITRKKSLKYLILDARINRAATRLDRVIITVSEFLSIASNVTYNPARHCGLQPAPAPTDQPILVARRRLASCASSSNSANWFWLCINSPPIWQCQWLKWLNFLRYM